MCLSGCQLVSCRLQQIVQALSLRHDKSHAVDRIAAGRRAYQARSFEYFVDCTYVELFNESCSDLLRPGAQLFVTKQPAWDILRCMTVTVGHCTQTFLSLPSWPYVVSVKAFGTLAGSHSAWHRVGVAVLSATSTAAPALPAKHTDTLGTHSINGNIYSPWTDIMCQGSSGVLPNIISNRLIPLIGICRRATSQQVGSSGGPRGLACGWPEKQSSQKC